jgi:hypothetical protein
VRAAVCKVRERCFAEFVFLQLPEVRQIQPNMKTDGPIIILSLDTDAPENDTGCKYH